jgi:single-stranded-DNA-specific exonuclease
MLHNTLIDAVINYNQIDAEQIVELFHPQSHTLSSFEGFLEAKSILLEAIEDQKNILIYGDYDVDGVCSTTILFLTLKQLKAQVTYHIPNRFEDGYGIQETYVLKALDEGIDLFILVDNGVSAHEAIERIHNQGKHCIILDHHTYTTVPQVACLIHSNLLNKPFQSLCASGLAQQLSEHLMGVEPYYITLAGIATIADMMPLWGYNRSIVQEALVLINQRRYKHLNALLPERSIIFEDDLAFQLIPKLNAVGRLVEDMDVNDLVKYLSYHNQAFQSFIREKILALNAKRKALDKQMYQRALELMNTGPIICVADESFHEGVVGITAGQLARTFKKPAFVFHRNQHRLKGSVRTYGSHDLIELIKPLMGYIERFGGHAAAAGIELQLDQFEAFKSALDNLVLPETIEQTSSSLKMDETWLNVEYLRALDTLRPFGQAFVLPRFHLDQVKVQQLRSIKGGIKANLIFKNQLIQALYFNPSIDMNLFQQATDFYGRITIDSSSYTQGLILMIDTYETD